MIDTLSDAPARLPDRTSVADVLSGLAAGLDCGGLGAALSDAFPGFAFSVVGTTDRYFLQRRSVLAQDGSRVSEDLQLWLRGVLDQHEGDVSAAWKTLKDSELHLAEWHGGPSAAAQDFVLSPEGRKLLAVIAPMPAVARRALLDWLRSMVHHQH